MQVLPAQVLLAKARPLPVKDVMAAGVDKAARVAAIGVGKDVMAAAAMPVVERIIHKHPAANFKISD